MGQPIFASGQKSSLGQVFFKSGQKILTHFAMSSNNVENIQVICGKYLWGLFEYFVFGEWVNRDLRCNNSFS